jgi:hypothetical protein
MSNEIKNDFQKIHSNIASDIPHHIFTLTFMIYLLVSGRGVVASTNIREGSFVVIYAGKIVRTEPSGADTYVYEVRKGKQYW